MERGLEPKQDMARKAEARTPVQLFDASFRIFSNSPCNIGLPAAMWPLANISSLSSRSVT